MEISLTRRMPNADGASVMCAPRADEIDAIGKARGLGGGDSGTQEREQGLLQLLYEMDGFAVRAPGPPPHLISPDMLGDTSPKTAHRSASRACCSCSTRWMGSRCALRPATPALTHQRWGMLGSAPLS